MTVQTITLRLPEPLYRTARQIAQVTKRPIETVLQDSLSAVLPPLDDVEPDDWRCSMTLLCGGKPVR
jgi:hypothetical protein